MPFFPACDPAITLYQEVKTINLLAVCVQAPLNAQVSSLLIQILSVYQ